MTKRSEAFVIANDLSPVVSGSVIGTGGQGGRYTLADGTSFRLSLDDCRALPSGYPIWRVGKNLIPSCGDAL